MSLSSLYVQAADGTRLHVRHSPRARHGITCLLIHGSGDGLYVWNSARETVEPLCPIAMVDLRGHGDSQSSRSQRYDLETHVSDVIGVIRALEIGSLIIVGHSLGGRVAIHLAAKLPRVIGAVLVDTCPEPNHAASAQASRILRESMRVYRSSDEYATSLLDLRPLLSAKSAHELAAGALRRCAGGFELKIDPLYVQHDSEERESVTPGEWRELLRAIPCPTLVVRGGVSAMVSAANAKAMVSLLPRGELVTIAKAGHAVMSDNPRDFRRALADFVSGRLRAIVTNEYTPLHPT